MSGMPPHPGPDEINSSHVQKEVCRINQEVIERAVLTQEQNARIATKRKIAIHRAAKNKAKQQALLVEQGESHSADNNLTDQQKKNIDSNKAEALRRAERAKERRGAEEEIGKLNKRIDEREQARYKPINIDLTLTPDDMPSQPKENIDLTKPSVEPDARWRDLATKGQILLELINTTAAWKHRACLTKGAATVTMVTKHSLPKSKLAKFLNYIRREGKTPLCTPTVPGGHTLGGVGSITTQARRAIQVTPRTEAFSKAVAKGRVGIFAVNLTKGNVVT